MAQATSTGLLQRPAVRQFVKFCIIGASSAIIDIVISSYLIYQLHWNWILANACSFIISVSNGFFWNSRWTFRQSVANRQAQYFKFVVVNIIGLGLNLFIQKSVIMLYTGKFFHQGTPPKTEWIVAKLTAIILVAMWNFFVNKKWTFKEGNAPLQNALEQA